MFFIPDMQKLRPNNMKMLELIDAGCVDVSRLATDLLGWMDDKQIADFCHANDICLNPEETEEPAEEGDSDEED